MKKPHSSDNQPTDTGKQNSFWKSDATGPVNDLKGPTSTVQGIAGKLIITSNPAAIERQKKLDRLLKISKK